MINFINSYYLNYSLFTMNDIYKFYIESMKTNTTKYILGQLG